MSIERYLNIESINANLENEGKIISEKDLFLFSKNEKEDANFGECPDDVLEVSVYDIDNNFLPNKNGQNVAYIKMPDIKTYVYNITNRNGIRELAIDVEKLLNSLGFFEGIFKINLNFVKNKVGSDNQMERVWIQEVSPTRGEIRILPLVTSDKVINEKTDEEFSSILELNKNFSDYRNAITNFLATTEKDIETIVKTFIESTYGKEWFSLLKRDFGVSTFDELTKRIYTDFKTSVEYYLNNKNYYIGETNYGKTVETIRFETCNQYSFKLITDEIKKILFECVMFNTSFLKKKDPTIIKMSKEFGITTLRKDIKDNLESFEVNKHKKRNVYNPKKVDVKFNNSTSKIEYNYDEKNDEERIENEEIRLVDNYPPEDENTTTPFMRDDLMPTDPIMILEYDQQQQRDKENPNVEQIRQETGNIVLKDGSQINRWGQENFTPPGFERRTWPKEEDRPDNRQRKEGKPTRVVGETGEDEGQSAPTQKDLQSDLNKLIQKISSFEEKAQSSNMNLNTGTTNQ